MLESMLSFDSLSCMLPWLWVNDPVVTHLDDRHLKDIISSFRDSFVMSGCHSFDSSSSLSQHYIV